MNANSGPDVSHEENKKKTHPAKRVAPSNKLPKFEQQKKTFRGFRS